MAVVNMVFEKERLPENAVNVRWVDEKPEHGKGYWLHDTYTGCCVKEREYNGYHDSDFYMTVWDEKENRFKEIEFASTRGWCYPCFTSRVDATPEVMERYKAHLAERERKYWEERKAVEARTPSKGKMLKVVKGRKVPLGTVGVCIWTGTASYGGYQGHRKWLGGRTTERVGLKDETGTVHWTAASNVEVLAENLEVYENRLNAAQEA